MVHMVRPPKFESQLHHDWLCELGQSELTSLYLSFLTCKMELEGLNELMHIKHLE